MSVNSKHHDNIPNISGDFQEGLSLELSVRGPQGWAVEPKSVSVRYSRKGLKGCENDVDFSFTGFEVIG